MNHTTDKNGNVVQVGTKVKVLEISQSLLSKLDNNERLDVMSMKDQIFTVYEIDEHGQAWVEKWWRENEKESFSHSLGLSPTEMEVASENSKD